MLPLDGLLVLDFSQYLSGPSAALRLADLGARVIKIERPGSGDNSRTNVVFRNLRSGGDSLIFHTINRNKESYTANLKDETDRKKVLELIRKADVLIENFRPGVMDRLGFGYDDLKKINNRLIYASISGYGKTGPWVGKPGQDLMMQSISGITWLTGDSSDGPVPCAMSIADSFSGAFLVNGILSCLVRRSITGEGGLVETTLLDSLTAVQFEVITAYLNDGNKLPQRSSYHNAHAYLGAPYGIYKTRNGYIALAMGSLSVLSSVLDCPELAEYSTEEAFTARDEIKTRIGAILIQETTAYWLEKLSAAGYWCSDVWNWKQLYESEAFKALDFLCDTTRPGTARITTTRCPIRIDGKPLKSSKWAPSVGADTSRINKEFNLEGEL